LEEELDKDIVFHRFYSTYTAITLPRRFLKGDFKIGGQVIYTMKYADNLAATD
jgi:hypothetical protein